MSTHRPRRDMQAGILSRSASPCLHCGVRAKITVWAPRIGFPSDISLAKIRISNGNNTDSIEVGWHISPARYGDSEPHLYIYTGTNVPSFNEHCPHFRPSGLVPLGQPLCSTGISLALSVGPPIGYRRVRHSFSLQQESAGGNWVFRLDGNLVGEFLVNALPQFRNGAASVYMGGSVITYSRKTETQMGSGYRTDHKNPREIADFTGVQVSFYGDNNVFRAPRNPSHIVSHPSCFTLKLSNASSSSKDELSFFYGGRCDCGN